jgi:hypothetical protein
MRCLVLWARVIRLASIGSERRAAASSTKTVRCGLLALVLALLWPWPLAAAPVAVRFAEGVTHGFLQLGTVDGVSLRG